MTAECQNPTCRRPVPYDPADARLLTTREQVAGSPTVVTEMAVWATCPHCQRRNYIRVPGDGHVRSVSIPARST